jgi:hypothetical protein
VSAANLASGAYGFDRWKSTFTNTALTYTSAPQGQEVTISSGGSIEQIVERANLPAGTYTLSWTGTATGRVYNTGATPPSYAASPITITLDGTANVEVEFTAAGGTKTLSKVQLEAGSSATAFRRNGDSVQAELAACQRYYFRMSSSTSGYHELGQAVGRQTTQADMSYQPPVTMRVTPTSVDYAGTQKLANYYGAAEVTVTSVTLDTPSSPFRVGTILGAASGLSAGQRYMNYFVNTSGTFIGFSAEL